MLIDESYNLADIHHDDEYICIINNNSELVLHSLHPEKIGNDVSGTLLLGTEKSTLGELISDNKNFAGQYI